MLKKALAVATLAGALTGIAAAPALAADPTCNTGSVQVHVHGNLNGTPVDQDICSPA